MAKVAYSARALADLERLFDFLVSVDPQAANESAQVIVHAIEVLQRHPYIGRAVRGRQRELVISYGRTGYVALYRVARRGSRIEVLAIRHQREAGYR